MVLSLTMIVAGALLAVPATASGPQLTAQQYREDLDFLIERWLPSNKVQNEAERRETRDFLEGVRDRADELNDASFAMTILKASSFSRNGHNMIALGLLDELERLPIRIWWFADGAYVVKADPSNTDLLGARIESFGDLSVEQAFEKAAEFLPGNASWRRYRSVDFLTRIPFLRELGAAARPDELPMVFTLADGSRLQRIMSAESSRDPERDFIQPWTESLRRRADFSAHQERWPHVADYLETPPPYMNATTNVTCEVMEDIEACYIRIGSCLNADGPGTLHSQLFDAISVIEDEEPKHVVVDLRYNTGGNFFNTVPFSFGLGVLVPPDGKIFLLANRCTFSAAIVTMALIKQNAGEDRVVVVGEPIGDELRFWSEGGNVILPHSGILVTYRDGLHDMVDGCQPEEDCWWGAAAFEKGVGELDPDIAIDERFEDFLSGRDLYLEAVRDALLE